MQPPSDQRFYRGTDRILSGVCSGLAEGFHVDPLWVRLGFVLLAFVQGVGVLLYIVLWLLMPERVAGGAGGRSGFDAMSDDLKRAWGELKAKFSGTPATPPPAAATTSSPASPSQSGPPVTTPVSAPVTTASHTQSLWLGLVLVVIGLVVLANNVGFSDGGVVWPVGVVALGFLLLARTLGRKP